MSEMNIVDKAQELFNAMNCEKALKLLASMSHAEFIEWIQTVDELLNKEPVAKLDQIRLAKDYLEHHLSQLTDYDIDDDIDWFASIKFNQEFGREFEEALNRIEPLIGNHPEWDKFEKEMQAEKKQLPGITGKKESERLLQKKIDYRRMKLIQLEVLEEIYPNWKNIYKELINFERLKIDVNIPTTQQLSTAKGKINFIEEVYRSGKVNTYEEALNKAEMLVERKLYSDVTSFYNARRNLRIRQKK